MYDDTITQQFYVTMKAIYKHTGWKLRGVQTHNPQKLLLVFDCQSVY